MKITFRMPENPKREYQLSAVDCAAPDILRATLKTNMNLDDDQVDAMLAGIERISFKSNGAEIENVTEFPDASVLKMFPALKRINTVRITGTLPQDYLNSGNTPGLQNIYQYRSSVVVGDSDRKMNTIVRDANGGYSSRIIFDSTTPINNNTARKAKVKDHVEKNPANMDLIGAIGSLVTALQRNNANEISDIVKSLTGRDTTGIEYPQLLNMAISALGSSNQNYARLASTMLQTIVNIGGLNGVAKTSVDPVVDTYMALINSDSVPSEQKVALLQGLQQYTLANRQLSLGGGAPIFMGNVNVGGNFALGNNNSFGMSNLNPASGYVTPQSSGYPSEGGVFNTTPQTAQRVGEPTTQNAQPNVANGTSSATRNAGNPVQSATAPEKVEKEKNAEEPAKTAEKNAEEIVKKPEKPVLTKAFNASYAGLDRTSKPYRKNWIQRTIVNHPIISSVVGAVGASVGITAGSMLSVGIGSFGITSMSTLGTAIATATTASLGVIAPVAGAIVAVGAIAGAGRRFTKMGRLRALSRKFERREHWFKNQENKFSKNMTRINDLDNRMAQCEQLLASGKLSEYEMRKTQKELDALTEKRINTQIKMDKNYNKMRKWNGRANHYGMKIAEKEQKYGKTLAYNGLVNKYAKLVKCGKMAKANALQSKYKDQIDLAGTYASLKNGTYDGTYIRNLSISEDKMNKATADLQKVNKVNDTRNSRRATARVQEAIKQAEMQEKAQKETETRQKEREEKLKAQMEARDKANKAKAEQEERRRQAKEQERAEKEKARAQFEAKKAEEKAIKDAEKAEKEKRGIEAKAEKAKEKEAQKAKKIEEKEKHKAEVKSEEKLEGHDVSLKAKDATSEEIQDNKEEIINPTEFINYADDKEGKEQAVADVRAGITNALDNMVAFNGMTKEEAEAIQRYVEKGYLDTVPEGFDPIELAREMANMPLEKQQEIMDRVNNAGGNPALVGVTVAHDLVEAQEAMQDGMENK